MTWQPRLRPLAAKCVRKRLSAMATRLAMLAREMDALRRRCDHDGTVQQGACTACGAKIQSEDVR